MDALLAIAWALVAIALVWAVVGLIRYVRFARGERTLGRGVEPDPLADRIRLGADLPRPRLPDRHRYRRARARRVLSGQPADPAHGEAHPARRR